MDSRSFTNTRYNPHNSHNPRNSRSENTATNANTSVNPFTSYIKLWKRHKFKIMVCAAVIFLIVVSIMNVKETGTWSLEHSYNPTVKRLFKYESRGEKKCRDVLEDIFHKAFPNLRPDFLLNNITGKKLEIDCCNLDLKLGVEYNGEQHYKYNKHMHKNYQDFQLQQYKDDIKKRLCRENDFNLIIVPYTVHIDDIREYLIEELRKLNYIN